MNVTITHVQYRPDKSTRPRRVAALVDGHLVTYRSEANRGWTCRACEVWRHADCQHVKAAWKAVHP